MVQSLRETLIDMNEDLGELCWSSFDDNASAYLSGLNPKTFLLAYSNGLAILRIR